MESTTAVALIVLINAVHFTVVDGAWSKRSDNETFFKSSFNPCKGSQPRHPVEIIKTHVFATKLFNEIGIKRMIQFWQKYQVPREFFYKIGDLGCLYALFGYTALSDRGSMILPPKVKATQALAIIKWFFTAGRIALPEIVLHSLGRTYSPPWEAVDELFGMVWPAILKIGEGDIPRDVNMLLHAVDHARRMLL